MGRDIILQLVTSSYFWPSLCRDVERFIARCRVCQLSKGKASNAGLSTQDSVSSPLMAEVLAIRMALISAVNREIIHPNFFSGNATLIREINNDMQVKEIYGMRYSSDFFCFFRIPFFHLSRSVNGDADKLAKASLASFLY